MMNVRLARRFVTTVRAMGTKLTRDELLRKYQAGVRDFRGADLRGVDLREADLSGADLQGTDLRGTDFGGARLQSASLREVRTGSCWYVRAGRQAGLTLGSLFRCFCGRAPSLTQSSLTSRRYRKTACQSPSGQTATRRGRRW